MSITKQQRLIRRKYRVRKKIFGTSECPRMSVFRSLKHIYVQIIDDEQKKTLVAASTLSKELKEKINGKNKTEQAKLVGELIAKNAKMKGITKVVFDRGGYKYHGRIKALADSARSNGLMF